MNKSFEALCRGYILFSVNKKKYITYNIANKAKDMCSDDEVYFEGFHVFKGWRAFYIRFTGSVICDVSNEF